MPKLIEAVMREGLVRFAEHTRGSRWHAVNGLHRVALARAGATVGNGKLVVRACAQDQEVVA